MHIAFVILNVNLLFMRLAEKLKVQEDLFRARSMRREGELRREYLLNKAKILQARATKHKARVSYYSYIITLCIVLYCTYFVSLYDVRIMQLC